MARIGIRIHHSEALTQPVFDVHGHDAARVLKGFAPFFGHEIP
jgi:hypothetical protein